MYYRKHYKWIGLTQDREDEPGTALFYNLITAQVNIVVLYEWDGVHRIICLLQPKLIVSQFTCYDGDGKMCRNHLSRNKIAEDDLFLCLVLNIAMRV